MNGISFSLAQRLATNGARAVQPFRHAGNLYLVVPQAAEDVPHRPAGLNAGDSNIETLVYRWDEGGFREWQRLAVSGGEDAEYFTIKDRAFLAVASLRKGSDPYDFNSQSVIFELIEGAFRPFQTIPTFAAKQWRHFHIEGRHFLALAQGIETDQQAVGSARSAILEWDGARFEPIQEVPSHWGYNWEFFSRNGSHYLAYADHTETSRVLKWTGGSFEPLLDVEKAAGRAFCFFEQDGDAWLAFANLTGSSRLYRWGSDRLTPHQTIEGVGMREFATVVWRGRRLFILVRFIAGTRQAPLPLQSCEYAVWQDGGLKTIADIPSSGATSAAFFEADGSLYAAIACSLTPDLRFRTDTLVYRVASAD